MITSITIGPVTLNDNQHYGITGVPGLEMPPVRVASYNLAGQDYGSFVSAYYGKRRFAITGWVIGDDVSDFLSRRDALRTALDASQGEQTIGIVLVDGRSLAIDAVLWQLDFPLEAGRINAGPFRAEFEASFPYLVSATEHTQTLGLTTGGGGKVPPDTMPMGLSFGSGGKAFVENLGNAPSFLTFRITGPVTNPTIRNNTTNQELIFTATLATGEYLDIDTRHHTVTDETGRNRYDTKSGNWWPLATGTTEVRFIADSTDPDAQVSIAWRDAYLGV